MFCEENPEYIDEYLFEFAEYSESYFRISNSKVEDTGVSKSDRYQTED